MAKENIEDSEQQKQATDEAVNDIVHEESDELIEKQDQTPEDSKKSSAPKQNKLKQLMHWAATHKKLSIPVAVVLVLLVLAAVPYTRFTLAGFFLKQTVTVEVVDSKNGRPVSSANVALNGTGAMTDEQGRAELQVSVGYGQLDVSKKYYENFSSQVTVPVTKPDPFKVSLKATGRAVPVSVINAITKKPVVNATLTAEGTEVQTDDNGTALLVVPADKQEAAVVLSSEGFNKKEAKLTVTGREVAGNKFELTPEGKVYFLSNLSGNIDVVKTNLDGTDRRTVLEGTGKEDERGTVLLASRDWRYLALKSKRDGGDDAKLFLIDTKDDSVTVMDEGEATFNLVGWRGHHFVYEVDRNNKESWEPKQEALKSYNAEAKDIILLDETKADGGKFDYFYEWLGDAYILAEEIVYTKNISGTYNSSVKGKQATLWSIKPDGSGKRKLAGYNPDHSYLSISTRAYNPNEIYYVVNNANNNLYEYEGGGSVEKVEGKKSSDLYSESYPNYLVSPDGKQTFWSETRDGKSTMFVGNALGENEKRVAVLDEYSPYGWFSDDYLLVSEKGSELYIMPISGIESESDLVKVSDYYRPSVSFPGYGYGYGGGL